MGARYRTWWDVVGRVSQDFQNPVTASEPGQAFGLQAWRYTSSRPFDTCLRRMGHITDATLGKRDYDILLHNRLIPAASRRNS